MVWCGWVLWESGDVVSLRNFLSVKYFHFWKHPPLFA